MTAYAHAIHRLGEEGIKNRFSLSCCIAKMLTVTLSSGQAALAPGLKNAQA